MVASVVITHDDITHATILANSTSITGTGIASEPGMKIKTRFSPAFPAYRQAGGRQGSRFPV
jgi:hypothetical protein